MRAVEKWKWRIHWDGRLVVTRAHFTESEIRERYADAIRMPETRIVVELPAPDLYDHDAADPDQEVPLPIVA